MKPLLFCSLFFTAAVVLGQDTFKSEPFALELAPGAQPMFPAQIIEGPVLQPQRVRPAQLRINGRIINVPPGGRVQIQGQAVNGQIILDENGNIVTDGDGTDPAAQGSAADPAGPHVVDFEDGTQLHGALEGLDTARQMLMWRRNDVSAPFTFPLAQIAHVSFGARQKSESNVHATVKLTGGDWLVADVLGMQGEKLQLKLGDGSPLTVDRAQVEWVYFSKGTAPECYDGPTSLAGWTSGGGWIYRDGALRAEAPSSIGRHFETLPDQVEYQFDVDQGGDFTAFTVTLHNQPGGNRGNHPGSVQLIFRGATLQLWAQTGGNMKTEQVDLNKAMRGPGELGANFKPKRRGPTQYRVLEDYPGGRFVVFVDGRKAADWSIGKGKAGENRGGIGFTPMTWNANSEQTLSRIRVIPWDGRVPEPGAEGESALSTDRVFLAGGEAKEGRIEGVSADKIRLVTSNGAIELPREKASLVRFRRPENPPDEEPPVARVRLAQRGEFDAAGVAFKKGRFVMRTNFAGELALAAGAIREVEFLQAPWVAPKTLDVLVFKNGDQLRGLLDTAADGQKLRWRLAKGETPIEVETARASGVLFAPRGNPAAAKSGVFARFRNGDSLAGDFLTLDKESVVLDTASAGQLAIPRQRVQTLYFASDTFLPLIDGATEPEVWLAGLNLQRAVVPPRKKSVADRQPSPWLYFDGSYKLSRSASGRTNAMNGESAFTLGRVFEALPERAEISFDVAALGNGVFFSAQIFTEPELPGYMMQFHSQGLYIYDMAPREKGRAMIQQQQMQFGEKVKPDARRRQVRLLADRPSGRIAIVVDGALIGQFGQKTSLERNLGAGILITPQPNMPCVFSNFWMAPWNGQLPGKEPALAPATADAVVLANGDEAQGAVELATPEVVKLNGEAGVIDLPVQRLTMVELGGEAMPSARGARLRLAGRGALTVKSYRIENGRIVCESEVAGRLEIALENLQELVLSAGAAGKVDKLAP